MPTFTDKYYVPFLKGKGGEFNALDQLDAADKARLTPLIEIAPRNVDWKTDQPTETTTEALDGDADHLAAAWGTKDEIFTDLGAFDPSDRLDSGDHPVLGFHNDARGANLLAIPVTGLERDSDYQAAVRQVAATDGRGAAIRLTTDFTVDLDALETELDDLLRELELEPTAVDLLLDLGEVSASIADDLRDDGERILRDLPHRDEWRTLTLAIGAFPGSPATHVKAASTGTIPRRDWKVWNELRALTTPLPRLPAFGDYAIAHPDFLVFDPVKMTMTAGIRYTLADDWLVVRGGALKNRGGGQFHDLAAQLTRRNEYRGANHCAGCQFIEDCANRRGGPGSATTWRTVGTRHHLAQVDQQIANLP